jgi:propanol-preferring alcohol dehydrogenase
MAGLTMRAMVLEQPGAALQRRLLARPVPGPLEVLIKVAACGVCRTDLHIVDGDLPIHRLPLIPGHEIAGVVVERGSLVQGLDEGTRVGVPWLAASCGQCDFCASARENLCDTGLFTGYDRDGGYAQFTLADARFCFRLPERYDDVHAAPLLCAGMIGYRAFRMAGGGGCLGLYGFGAAAHLLTQLATGLATRVYAFTPRGDARAQAFAYRLGAVWAGAPGDKVPVALDAAIIFAPAGELVPAALAATKKGGVVVCAGIHMSDIPQFPYALLWGERQLRSVANLSRSDGDAYFQLLERVEVNAFPVPFHLSLANEALAKVRAGAIDGAAVLVPEDDA